MDEHMLKLLKGYKNGEITEEQMMTYLKKLPFEELGFAKVDHHRTLRSGFPEVIFCQGKEPEHITEIAKKIISEDGGMLLATRADENSYQAVLKAAPSAVYHKLARVITVGTPEPKEGTGGICVISAGTADMPVAEEAAVVAGALGNTVDKIYDAGVAGIHRLLSQLDRIYAARVIIAVAGMEGALASVVGGLTDAPVIAVPTSVGYGASFGGVSALLTMLNSCATGIGVVNIDNGFGAAWLANSIIKSGSKD